VVSFCIFRAMSRSEPTISASPGSDSQPRSELRPVIEISAFRTRTSGTSLDNFSRGYFRGRRDGTMSGLLIGSISGAIMVYLLSLLF
jgi:hypothetical protein